MPESDSPADDEPERTEPVEPKLVDGRFWLEYGRTLVETSRTQLEVAAKTLTTAVGWYWAAYSAAAVVGVAVAGESWTEGFGLLVATPIAVLFVAYSAATYATMPVQTTIIYEQPNSISTAHDRIIEVRRRRVIAALALTAVAAGLTVVAIVGFAQRSVSDRPQLEVDAVKTTDGVHVVVDGEVAAPATVTVTPKDGTAIASRVTPDGGRIRVDVIVPDAESYSVEMSWADNDETQLTATRSVEAP
jgi:hypothetical protein